MNKKHEQKFDGMVLTYSISGVGETTTDISTWPDDVKNEALKFAAKTLARNATAGLMSDDEDKKTAFERVVARFKNFADGVWRSGAGAESVERPTSMLALAFAEALFNANQTPELDPKEAAARIAGMIDDQVQKAGLSAEEEEDKPEIRKIAGDVRKFVASYKEVDPILRRIKAEESAKRATIPAKEDAPSIASVLHR